MTIQTTIPSERTQTAFWAVVLYCLRAFHGKGVRESFRLMDEEFRKIDGWPEDRQELFYHGEPFDVACRMTGTSIDAGERLIDYLPVRNRLYDVYDESPEDASSPDESPHAAAP